MHVFANPVTYNMLINYLLHICSSQQDLIEDFLAVNVFHLTAPVADS